MPSANQLNGSGVNRAQGIQHRGPLLQSSILGTLLAKSIGMFNLNIRGKRTSKCVQVEHAEAVVPSRRPGRPLKRAFELAMKRKRREILTAGTTGMQAHESHQLSKLEQLPEEILEQVFLHCLEINLPRSSLIFGHGLAQNRIYRSVLLLAFFNDDDREQPVPKNLFEPAPYRVLNIEEKLRLQADLMTCKWFSLDLVKTVMPELSYVAMIHACPLEDKTEDRCITTIQKVILQGDDPRTLKHEDQEALARYFMATEDGEYLPRIVCAYRGSRYYQSFSIAQYGTDRGIFNVRVIPDRFLDISAWTQEKIEMLRLLRHGWRFVHSDVQLTISVNALFAGLKRAIIESNTTALKVLLELHYAVYVQGTSTDDNFDVGWRRKTQGFRYPLPIGMYHMATRQGRNSSKLFRMLFRSDTTSLKKHHNDRIVTKWALVESTKGDHFAQFLLEFMAGFGRFQGEVITFFNGKGSPEQASTRAILREIHGHDSPFKTWTEELGYLDQRRNWPMRAEGYART